MKKEAAAAASLVTAEGITSRSALLDMTEAEDRPDVASFGRSSRRDEQPLLLRAQSIALADVADRQTGSTDGRSMASEPEVKRIVTLLGRVCRRDQVCC